jgi:hypothetical protein
MLATQTLFLTRTFLFGLLCLYTVPAFAFPPYRSTDADTADPNTLELRIGLIKWEHDSGESETATPLWRANVGLGNKVEIISEFEYLPRKGEFGDAAAGIKWIPFFGGPVSFGNETLFLLPVRPGDARIGVESQLLATYWHDDFRVHFNAGGFHDPRTESDENGWRGSVLAEFPRAGYRPGLELFAKQVDGEPVDARAGFGGIFDLGAFEVRTGVHAGLTERAPDLSFNLWIATAFSL